MDRPGYKTTEFWLSVFVFALGSLMASGVVADGGMIAKIVGGALSVLAALGYGYDRSVVKRAALEGPRPDWVDEPDEPDEPPE